MYEDKSIPCYYFEMWQDPAVVNNWTELLYIFYYIKIY